MVLISHGKIVIAEILNSAPDEFKHSRDFEAFLANEIGVIMCLNLRAKAMNDFSQIVKKENYLQQP